MVFFVYVRILQCAQQLNFRPINLHTVNHLKSGEWGRGGGEVKSPQNGLQELINGLKISTVLNIWDGTSVKSAKN